jgi:hypothetical protein
VRIRTKTSIHLDLETWDIVGKTILAVEITQDRESVMFNTDDGVIKFVAEGDCCSRSWIEDFDHEGIVGSTVTKIEEIEVPPSPDDLMDTKYPENQQDYDKAYFFKLTTTSGNFTIEMRNSSNGYYGGWLEEVRA